MSTTVSPCAFSWWVKWSRLRSAGGVGWLFQPKGSRPSSRSTTANSATATPRRFQVEVAKLKERCTTTADRTLLDIDRMSRGRCRAPEGQARLANRTVVFSRATG